MLAPRGVERPHATDVGREVALGDEIGERRLVHGRHLLPGESHRRAERIDQRRRHDQIAGTERGEHRLAEGADVDHAPRRIQPLHRRDRPAGVAILAVVVILQDPCARLRRPCQERETPREAHGRAERKLVRGRDVDETRGTSTAARLDVDPLLVDRHGNQARTSPEQRPARAEVAGILDPGGVPRVQQQPAGEVEPRLRTGDDDHLIGVAGHAACATDVGRDRLPQRRQPSRVRVAEAAAGRHAGAPPQEARPDLTRKLVQCREPGLERAPADVGKRPARGDERTTATRQVRGARTRGRRDVRAARMQQRLGQHRRHAGAVADPGLDVSLGRELLEGAHHRVAGGTELVGERPGGRQARARREASGEDGLAQGGVDLALERDGAGALEGQGSQERARPGHSRCLGPAGRTMQRRRPAIQMDPYEAVKWPFSWSQ